MKTRLFFAALAFIAITSMSFSQNGNPQKTKGTGNNNCTAWVDEDKDGVCDNYQNGTHSKSMSKNGMMNDKGKGRFFVDTNNNGVCDVYENIHPAGRE
jgi:hypothetical protein